MMSNALLMACKTCNVIQRSGSGFERALKCISGRGISSRTRPNHRSAANIFGLKAVSNGQHNRYSTSVGLEDEHSKTGSVSKRSKRLPPDGPVLHDFTQSSSAKPMPPNILSDADPAPYLNRHAYHGQKRKGRPILRFFYPFIYTSLSFIPLYIAVYT